MPNPAYAAPEVVQAEAQPDGGIVREHQDHAMPLGVNGMANGNNSNDDDEPVDIEALLAEPTRQPKDVSPYFSWVCLSLSQLG